jgi:hypothetical protein
MTVHISQDEMNILNLNGISVEDAKANVDYLRATGLNDDEIRNQFSDTIEELRPLTKQSANDTGNIQTWKDKGPITPFEEGKRKSVKFDGTYSNIDENANLSNFDKALKNSKRNQEVEKNISDIEQKKSERNKRVNEGTGSLLDRVGAFIDRVGEGQAKAAMDSPDDLSIQMSGINNSSKIDKSQKIGFQESLANSYASGAWIPFAGGWITGSEDKKQRDIIERIRKGEAIRPDELGYINHKIQQKQEENVRGYSLGGNIAKDFLPSLIRFGTEMGVGGWALKGLGLGVKATEGASLGQKALAGLGDMVQTGVVNTALPTGWNNINEIYQSRMLDNTFKLTDKGESIFQQSEEKPSTAFYKSIGQTFIMFASEASGELLKLPIQGAGAAASKYIGSPIAKYLASNKQLVNLYKKSVPTFSKLYEKINKLPIKGENVDWLKSKVRYDGFLEELGEEVVEDVLNLTIGTDNQERSLENYAKAIFKSPDEWAVLAGAIALQGGTLSAASHILGNHMERNGATDDEIVETLNNLSENDKEKAVENLIQNGEINIDSTTEERIENNINNLAESLLDTGKYSNREQAEKVARLGVNMLGSIADKTGIDIEELINEDMPNIEQDNETTYVDDNGVLHSGVSYNEQEQTLNDRYNDLVDKLNNLPDDYSDEEHLNKMITETDLLEKIQSGEKLSLDDMESVNDLIEEYETNGNNNLANQLRQKLDNTNVDFGNTVVTQRAVNNDNPVVVQRGKNETQHFQRATTAGATTKEEKSNAIKEWKEKGTDSKYFKKWFGDSKVVDENGKPLVVYHGSLWKFDTFGKSDEFDFSFSPKFAYEYAAQKSFEQALDLSPVLYSVYLKAENPFDFRDEKSVNELLKKIGDKEISFWGDKYSHEQFKDLIMGLSYENTVKNQEVFDKAEVGMAYSRYNEDVEEKMSSVADAKIVYKNKDYFVALDEIDEPRRSPFSSEPVGRVDRDDVYKQVEKLAKDIDFADEYIKKITLNTNLVKTTYEVGKGYVDEYTPYELTVRLRKVDNPKIAKKGAGYDNWSFFETTKIGDTYFLDFLKENGYDSYYKQEKEQLNISVFNPEQIKSVDNKGMFNENNPNIYFQRATSNNNNVVDLTNDFEKAPSIDEVKAYINEIVENGTKFATLSPNWFVDIKKESSNKKQKRITNKILNKGNYKGLNKKETSRYNKYLASLEKLLANAEYAGEKENTKKDKKPNVEKYHYFKTDVKIGNKIYQLIFDTEEYKNSPQIAQHDNRVLNPQSEDNSIINDNAENINPKTVHLYNIKEIKNPKMYFQSAYHGSPHKFDEFSLDAIGTGEGAQAHGWGLYFAANKEISHGYMERLSEGEWRYKGKRLAGGEIFFYKSIKEDKQGTINLIQNRIDKTQAKLKNKQKELKETKSPIFSDSYKDEIKSLKTEIEYQKNNLKKIKSIDVSKIEFKTEGQLFEVDIPDVDEMLDEDKDLIHQSNKVQRAIEKIYSDAMASNNVKLTNAIGITGKETYRGFLEYFGSDKKASEFLNSYGIKGITYDGRQDGRCYVVFDDKAVQVLKKYYQKQRKMFIDNDRADEIANRLVQVKGSFIPAENLVKLFKDADESTIVHEFAHWWLEKLVKHSEGNEELQEDLKEIRKFVKNNGEEFTDEQHERFARGFEAYMRTGSAKTNRLKKLFEDFKNALLSLYDSIKSLGFEESEIPEINNLFDRLLTTENQRIQAAVFDRCNTIQSQIEEIRTNQEKELSEIDEIEKNNLERSLQDTRKKQQVEEYLNLADKASSRVPKSVKEYSKRCRQACYEILSAALNHKYSIKYLQMTLAQNNTKAENLRQELSEVDDDITALGGMQSNWYEFFSDTGVNYDTDETDGDARLVEQALDRIDSNNFTPPETYPGEEIIGKFMGAFDYLSGKVLSLRGANKDAAFEALSELFSGRKFGNLIELNRLPQDVMNEISVRMDEISKTYIEQKTNEKNKYAIPNVSLSTQLRTYVSHKLHETKSYDPIEKKYVRLSSVNKMFSLLPLVNNSLTAKEVVRTINAHAIKQLENRQKYILHKEIQKQVKINSKLIKVGALKQGKFDWKTNTVFSELQQMNRLKKDEARVEYLRLIDADSAVIGEERDNINQDATNDIKAPTDFQGILKVKFLEYKSNDPKNLNLSATRSLLEDILQLKFEGRRAKSEQDLKKALTRYDYKNNLIEIMDKHRDNKVAKYLARWTAGDTIWTSEGTLANWESLLTGIFDKATAEKYSLLKAESDVEVYAHRKALGFYKKAMDIYHLNRSNEGLKNKFLNVWDRALDFDNIQPLVDLFRKYDETNYPFKQVTWNKDTGEFVETTIELSHSQLITLYAWSLNPNLKERLITQFVGEDVPKGAEKLDELMFSKLSEQDKLFAWAMVDTCDTMYEDTNEVFIRTTGLSLPKVDNYIPSKTERIGSDLDMMHETMLRSTNPSFIKQRKNCSRIKMDPLSPLEIILPHINKTARYVVMSEKVNFYNRIFQSPDIKAKMVEIYGKKSGEKIHRILLNQLATSTYDNYAKSITVGKNLIDNVASNYITSKIGGNLKVMFSQLTSMVNYCENMPFGTWSKGFADALAHPKKTVDFMFKNCEYLQARLAGNSQNEIISMLTNESDKFRALRNFCTSNTKYGDIIAIMFGGKPYVDYLMSQGMSQEEAFTKFTENTLRSQQSGHSSATSAWQKQVAQHAITRMIFAFNNTNFQYERKFVDSMANLAKGDISNEEFMKSFLIYKVFNPILFTSFLSDLSLLMLFQNMFGGGDDDPLTAFGSDIISSILLSNWKAYGILGTLANSIVSLISAKMTGGMYFEDKLPLISDFETSINKLMRGSKLELGDYIEMIAGAGDYGTGIAASRLYNAAGGVGDIMQGNIGTGLLRIGGYGKYKANMAATGQPPERKKK